MTKDELIDRAAGALRPRTVNCRLFGDVAAALVTERGSVFLGVCIDTPSWGLCAERSAVAAMVTAGEYRIAAIVAVWREATPADSEGALYALPPCGHCRQFMVEIDRGNLETDVILGRGRAVKLKDLLPHHEWPKPLDSPD